MKIEHVVNIADLHRAAKRRMPRVAFDYFEGGAEDEGGLALNRRAFQRQNVRTVPNHRWDESSSLDRKFLTWIKKGRPKWNILSQ